MKNIEIRQIEVADLKYARTFAAKGMNLEKYTSNRFELYLYSKYVLYEELAKSTVALGAYWKDKLVGFLFAKFENEQPIFANLKNHWFVRLGKKIIELSSKQEAANSYDTANKEMYQAFSSNKIDGEITFFAVHPEMNGLGIGSQLLNELERLKKDKFIYLYTDSGCNYPFYLKKGFDIFDEKQVSMGIKDKQVDLTCYLLYKKLASSKE